MYYLIHETLTEVQKTDIQCADAQFVAVLTAAEWEREKDSFDMGIDIEPTSGDIHSTKAEVNYDSLTGSFLFPDRQQLSQSSRKFATKRASSLSTTAVRLRRSSTRSDGRENGDCRA